MSFGRPVLPPEVITFHDGLVAGGNGCSSNDGDGCQSSGIHGRPSEAGGPPTTSSGFASATIAARSTAGNADDTGCGTAPIFQRASTER